VDYEATGGRLDRQILAHAFAVLQKPLHGALVADDSVFDDVGVIGEPACKLEVLVGEKPTGESDARDRIVRRRLSIGNDG
jgi:hypothetical protein